MKILVVDDDPKLRTLLVRFLHTKGFDVAEAENGAKGVVAARTQRPGLIITDLNMPGLGGLDLIREIRALPETKDTPVIVLTGEDGPTHYNAIYDAGADAYVAKPVDFERLLGRVLEFT